MIEKWWSWSDMIENRWNSSDFETPQRFITFLSHHFQIFKLLKIGQPVVKPQIEIKLWREPVEKDGILCIVWLHLQPWCYWTLILLKFGASPLSSTQFILTNNISGSSQIEHLFFVFRIEKIIMGTMFIQGWMQETLVLFCVTPCILICFLAKICVFCLQMTQDL